MFSVYYSDENTLKLYPLPPPQMVKSLYRKWAENLTSRLNHQAVFCVRVRARASESSIQKHDLIERMDVIEIPKLVSWIEVSPIFSNIFDNH